MEKGLVLCGGGSLGAYEAGAYQYLLEKGLTFSVMTGTSIGALNAAMYAVGDFEKNLEIWKNVTVHTVLRNGINLTPNTLKNFSRSIRKEIINYAQDYLWYGGGDAAPLKSLIEENVDPQRIKECNVKVGIVTTKLPSFEEYDVLLNEVDNDLISEFLIASSACYPLLPIKWIKGKPYIDGGYRNNMPIDYALRLGAEEIIAIELHAWPRNPQHPELKNLPFVTLITPSRKTGSFFDFTRQVVDESIELGYLDAKKALGDSYGFAFTFKKGRNVGEYGKILTGSLLHRGHIYDYHKIQEAFSYQGNVPTSEEDLFIRTIEFVGDIMGVPFTHEYDLRTYLRTCEKKVQEYARTLKTFNYFALHRGSKKVNPKHYKDLLACLYGEVKEGSYLSTYETLTAASPEVAALIALYLLLKERNLL